MENKDDSLESNTISALLSYSKTAQHSNVKDILSKFAPQLKTNFEHCNLWLRFGLALAFSRESPRSALQAFNECMRINQNDPLPAMLAAKLVLEDLDDPDNGLTLANESIKRCLKDDCCYYKNINPILSRCYLLASIMNAYIYEREPESIKQFKSSNLTESLKYLDLASEVYSNDYLLYFHKALHEAKRRSYSSAIDNVRQAIKLNPQHVPSMQLFILSLSALKLYDEALVLCQSALHEFEDNILLLYIKCNLEQRLDETKGFRMALDTAQHILKCIRKSRGTEPITSPNGTMNQPSDTKQSTNLFSDDKNNNNCLNSRELLSGELSVWLLVAEIYIKMGSIIDAELCVDEGSTYVNGALSHQIMFVRGLIAKAKNNLIEAKSFFQSCLALWPKHADALQQIAHVHYQLGNYSTAEKFLKDSLDVDNGSHKTWYYLSLVFIETNQHDKASECSKKALILEESSPIISISAISRLTLE